MCQIASPAEIKCIGQFRGFVVTVTFREVGVVPRGFAGCFVCDCGVVLGEFGVGGGRVVGATEGLGGGGVVGVWRVIGVCCG